MRSPSADERGLVAEERDTLVRVAREAVRRGLAGERRWVPPEDDLHRRLLEPGASFVTLRRRRELLGCIGSIEPHRPLAHDVAANASSAAFADPRLPAVTHVDYEEMSVKVSVLGALRAVEVDSYEELSRVVRPGVDGLLIADRARRGTFLPSVWEQVRDRDTFLDMLWQKAGLTPRTWSSTLEVYRYETDEFGD